MSAPTSTLPARTSEGCLRAAGIDVHWRVGTRDPADDPSVVARAWVEQLVRTRGLFPWNGFADGPPRSRPRLGAPAHADVSISHSGAFVAVAVAVGGRVGIDVEAAPFTAFGSTSLRRRMLTPAENARLTRLPADRHPGFLARVWTAKEAWVKCTGEGMRRDFREVGVPALAHAPDAPFEAALAVAGRYRAPEIHRLTEDASPAKSTSPTRSTSPTEPS